MESVGPVASRYRITVSPTGLPRFLVVIVAALIALHLGVHIPYYSGYDLPWDIRLLFDADEEASVPTWYSGSALVVAFLLTLAVAGAHRRDGARDVRYWKGLAIGLLVMSLDEIVGLHEMANTYMDVDWTIPAAIIVAALGVPYALFLSRLPARTRWGFVMGAAVFLGGALGVESYVGNPFLFRYRMDSLPYQLSVALEEGMEMIGVVIYLRALLGYMASGSGAARTDPVTVEIRP